MKVGCSQIKNIQKLNDAEISKGLSEEASWHAQYKNSPYIFIGGLSYDLSEGDVCTVFAQYKPVPKGHCRSSISFRYGEIQEIHLVRDKETGKSRGFAFLGYEDQRSTVLAVDNLNGIQLGGRTIRVDHVANYKSPKEREAKMAADKAAKETKIAEMADEIFRTAVGGLFAIPSDYDERAAMLSPKSIAAEEIDVLPPIHEQGGRKPKSEMTEDEREARRRLKQERRARESSEERRARKTKTRLN